MDAFLIVLIEFNYSFTASKLRLIAWLSASIISLNKSFPSLVLSPTPAKTDRPEYNYDADSESFTDSYTSSQTGSLTESSYPRTISDESGTTLHPHSEYDTHFSNYTPSDISSTDTRTTVSEKPMPAMVTEQEDNYDDSSVEHLHKKEFSSQGSRPDSYNNRTIISSGSTY